MTRDTTMAISLSLESDEFHCACRELADLLEKLSDFPLEVVQLLLCVLCDPASAVELDSATTGGTCVVTLKPSQLFLDLLAAVRALD